MDASRAEQNQYGLDSNGILVRDSRRRSMEAISPDLSVVEFDRNPSL